MTERLSLADFRARCQAQGVPGREHYAFKCPSCGAVQSIASLVRQHGMNQIHAERALGSACKTCSASAGSPDCCQIEVTDHRGDVHQFFALATPEEARRLAGMHTEDAA